MSNFSGGCVCQAVRYSSHDPAPRPVIVCHCRQCRQFTGYTFAATAVKRQTLEITGEENLSWYQSSAAAKRGFCKVCGSSLFWDNRGSDSLSIAAGTVDQEADLAFGWHIFVDDQPPYYRLSDECLKYAAGEDSERR